MFLERQTVSRKTPGDGRLEISSAAADRLRAMAAALEVSIGELHAPGHVETMPCSCRKAGSAHEHHFVASDALRTLHAATEVELHVEELANGEEKRARVTVRPVA